MISASRVLCAFCIAYLLLEVGSHLALSIACLMILYCIFSDALDGYVARRYGFSGKIGELSDLYADHILANTLWVSLAFLGLVSVWVPLITTARDMIVDFFRQVHAQATEDNGFEQVKGSKHAWIVSSRAMRALYGGLKLASWLTCLLSPLLPLSLVCAFLVSTTVVVCLFRALPSIKVSWRYVLLRPF